MTKSELINNILEHITDPWTDDCENYDDADLIDIEYAKTMIEDARALDVEADLEPDECLPAEVTPELMMEVYNCHVKHMKHDLRVRRLAQWFVDNEPVCLHDNYYCEYKNNDPCVVPVEFLDDSDNSFYFDEDATIFDLIDIGMNSKYTFSDNDEYCWYDKDKKQLHSSNTPFHDGVIDVEAMADWFVTYASAEDFGYLLGEMEDEDILKVFGCTEDELLNECSQKGECIC